MRRDNGVRAAESRVHDTYTATDLSDPKKFHQMISKVIFECVN